MLAWLRILASSLAGTSLLIAAIAKDIGSGWMSTHVLHVLAAGTLALTLLLRIVLHGTPGIDNIRPEQVNARDQPRIVLYVAWITHYLEWSEWNTTRASLFATVGSAAGMLAHFRTPKVLRWCASHPMAVCIAVVIGLSPTLGITLTSQSRWQPGPPWAFDTTQGDFIATIASADFKVSIARECSGLEGALLFSILISVFLLYDWHLFGKMKGLGVVYLLVLPIVLVVNAVRIARIFLYAEWTITHRDALVSARITVDAFHSSAGLVLYTAVFGLILPLLYRWARRQVRSDRVSQV